MPEYVDDPDNPGKRIDVVELQKRDPLKVLPPVKVRHWLRRELWTRREAIKLLSGYDPGGTPWDESEEGFSSIPTGRITYLDGLMAHWLSDAGLHHPLSDECLRNLWTLTEYSKWTSLDERRTPREWLEWADSKSFQPYWFDWACVQGLIPDVQATDQQETASCHRSDALGVSTAADGRVAKNKDKLSPEQRTEIVRRLKAGTTQTALAAEFGVSRTAISKVANKSKKHGSQRNDPFGR